MASKKLKKAIKAGLAGVAGAKMLSSIGAAKKASIAAAQTDTGDLGSQMANDTALASAMRKNMEGVNAAKKAAAENSFFGKAKNFLKTEVFTTNPRTKIRDMLPRGSSDSEQFGLGPYSGAKYGKMIKAKHGVMARGCKLGRNKRTVLS